MRKQVVMTAPSKVQVGTYLTPKGARLKAEGVSKEVLAKYTKNRYKPNPNSKPFKVLAGFNEDGSLKTRTRIITHLNQII